MKPICNKHKTKLKHKIEIVDAVRDQTENEQTNKYHLNQVCLIVCRACLKEPTEYSKWKTTVVYRISFVVIQLLTYFLFAVFLVQLIR